ncbi:ABC transporter permease [Streptomyces sp. NBC_00286]|uniref:ABC transporter permease n=1 Tax=Streptomyces sp. NBC_00286 TaxID=2975701 RepID=UPI002E2C8ACB|nr:ABC transporter permease [Streptomyces sp. NBC_00286]
MKPAAAAAPEARAATLTFGGVLRSEWTKIRSLRSTVWTLVATVVLTIGTSALLAWAVSAHLEPSFLADVDPVRDSMSGLMFGQLTVAVIGAMAITSEYSTGTIRTTLTVVPRRVTVLTAKLTVLACVALVCGLLCSFVSFFIGQSFFANATVTDRDGAADTVTHLDLHVALTDPGVLRAVVGGGLYLAAGGLLALALGALLRNTAAAISTAIGLLFVVPLLANFLPSAWEAHVVKWLPTNAGSAIWSLRPTTGDNPMLGPWTGYGVFVAYVLTALLAAAVLLRRRDT